MLSSPRVAYFCMEYGLDPSFSIYAGGLGILAADRARWVGLMRASIAMSQWRFSSDRMLEDYVAKVYGPGSGRMLSG